MKKLFFVLMLGAMMMTVAPQKAEAGFRHCGFRCGGTIFTGGPLQFRPFQPVRNAGRLVARVGIRAFRFATFRPAFPGLWYPYWY